MRTKTKIWRFKFLIIQILILLPPATKSSLDQKTLDKVLKDFVRINGMKMDEYNYWWLPVSFDECANKCIDDRTILCRSFSYCHEAQACSTYEKARDNVPVTLYNPPGVHKDDPYGHYEWDYFERKSDKYRAIEEQVNGLLNLTEISIGEAGTVLNTLAKMVVPAKNANASEGNEAGSSALPSELEIAGKSLLVVMKLNPVEKASVDGIREFTDIVANVSSVLLNTDYASAWKTAQKNPAAPGSSAIVTSAEELTREASAKLLASQNATKGIVSKTDSIALWIDFESESSPDDADSGNDAVYVFPKRKRSGEVTDDFFQPSSFSTQTTSAPTEQNPFFQDTITLPRAALGIKSMVTNVRYTSLKEAIPTRNNDDKKLPKWAKVRSSTVNSAVLTTSIFPRPPSSVFEVHPVIIVFKHDREARGNMTDGQSDTRPQNGTANSPPARSEVYSEEHLHCVYWQEGKSEDDGGTWATDGCSIVESNVTHTTCNCTHLTSFAVLLQIVDYNTDDELTQLHLRVLSVISKVGCVLSLLGVILMCAAFVKLKFHTENMKIHFNLGVAVGLADLVFLFEELAEGSRHGCIIVTVLLYYFNMSVLAWMLIEGVHLYSQVVVVFVSARRWFKYYVVAGWGVPAFILAIAMGILNVQLGTNGICWLSPVDNSIWAFAAPALVVIMINTIILITVVRVIVTIQPDKSNNARVSKIRNAVKGSIFLFPLLGTTWLFGLLSLSQETLLFQYLFAITNSLQGFFLFVFHCLCNSEVREDVRRHKWFGSSKSSLGPGTPPLHSSPFSLNVANGLRRFRNSISFEMPTSSSGSSEGNASEVEDVSVKRLGKLLNLFPRMFTVRLPATIREGDEKYGPTDDDTSNSPSTASPQPASRESTLTDDTQHMDIKIVTETLERTVPLPGMPMKNDKIDIGRQQQMTLPAESQMKLDQMLADQIAKNAAEELKNNDVISSDDLKKVVLDEEEKMKMSYDSGLNSIDNESILDEEDEVWMANQQQQQQELKEQQLKVEDLEKEEVITNNNAA